MATRDAAPRRRPPFEQAGVIDFPWDVDPDAEDDGRSDATREIAWRVDELEAIEVFIDPALDDRAASICRTIEGLAGAHHDIDALSAALLELGRREDLGVAIHEQRPDELSGGVLAVAITPG